MEMYAIQDIKSELFNNPFYSDNDETAKRTVKMALQSDESPLTLYPEDYRLFKLGTFDNKTGIVTAEKEPKWVLNLTECVVNPQIVKGEK